MKWPLWSFKLLQIRDRLEKEHMNNTNFPPRASNERYVVIINDDDFGWSLNGQYAVHEVRVPAAVAASARENHLEAWKGWSPSMRYQIPLEFRDADLNEFTAFWVAR